MLKTKSITKGFYSKKIFKKRIARIMAVQCVYSMNITDTDRDIDQSIYYILQLNHSDIFNIKLKLLDEALFINLARGAYNLREQLIEILTPLLAENWRFNRLAKVIQAILLVGVYELTNSKGLAEAAIINEYLEIAKSFNHDSEAGFINKVLDKVKKNLLEI